MPQRPSLRKREIALALGIGVIGASGAALVLDGINDDNRQQREVRIVTVGKVAYNGEKFEKISTVGPYNVIVTKGDAYTVRAQGDPRAIALLEWVVDDGVLEIRPRGNYRNGGFNWSRFGSVNFFITAPNLEAVSLAGSGNVRIDRIEGGDFEGNIAGSGELFIADMQVQDAEFSIVGQGNITAAGTAEDTTVNIGGSGEIQASALRSKEASIRIGGSGDVAMAVSNEADVTVLGSGGVNIMGTTNCSVTRVGSGDVNCNGQPY